MNVKHPLEKITGTVTRYTGESMGSFRNAIVCVPCGKKSLKRVVTLGIGVGLRHPRIGDLIEVHGTRNHEGRFLTSHWNYV